ncbi:MAG TPA: glycerol-3-phosphate 1-O-acyltransferase PlsY [Candidatus Acidoferrales bacterium]|nr:glycerol-3-phosphate 1-O-acyltransferase PlsY [Candidatus Acidoferrales bacterium]
MIYAIYALYAALIGYLLLAFLIGSIPFGYLIGRFAYRTDIRKSGSGNIGAMNALRTLGTKGALAVLLLDAGKGALAVLLPFVVWHPHGVPALGGAMAVLGHCFSPWLRWKGGKGVATAFGAAFALSWPAGLVMVAVWILFGLVITRYSSVGSMAACIASPFALYGFTHAPLETAFGLFTAVLIPWTHRENIARLRKGTEGPIRLFQRKT